MPGPIPYGTSNGLRGMLCLSLCSAFVGACAKPNDRGLAVSADRTHAMLAAARASELTFFGDISDGRGVGYFSRHGVSLSQHSFSETGADFDVDIDSTGHHLVFASTRHNAHADLYIKNVDGIAVTQLTSDPAPDIQPAFSPDNSRVAFASHRDGTWDVWVASINGDPPLQVTHGAADEIHPSWSPDGTQLVYSSLPADGGQWELWIVDARAGGQRQFIGYGLFPEWSPVSDTILYQRARDQGRRWFSVWTVELVNGEPRYPTEVASAARAAMILPTWSADGTHIAFSRVDLDYANDPTAVMTPGGSGFNRVSAGRYVPTGATSSFDVWIMLADGRELTRLTDGHSRNYGPTIAPDGRVYFASDRSGFENVWSVYPGDVATSGDVTRGIQSTPPLEATRVGLVNDSP